MDETNAVTRIADTLLQVALPILTLLASWLVAKITAWFTKKTKVEIPAKQLALIDVWVHKGIHYAEEKARAAAKVAGAKVEGHEKLNAATAFVMGFVEERGWTDWSRERIEKLIESKLNVERKPVWTAAIPETPAS